MIKGLLKIFLPKTRPRYTYGKIHRKLDNHITEPARLDNKTGEVQFILWKAGEQGHEKDFWHNMGDGWENHFVAYE